MPASISKVPGILWTILVTAALGWVGCPLGTAPGTAGHPSRVAAREHWIAGLDRGVVLYLREKHLEQVRAFGNEEVVVLLETFRCPHRRGLRRARLLLAGRPGAKRV